MVTYGVQGATLTRALYHPGDASSFEEGYVALTRGGAETRIYIVDGALVPDEEVGHRAHEPENRGLDTVCEALEQRRSRMLAHEADPTAAAVRNLFEGWDLQALRTERKRLQAVLGRAPASVDQALQATIRRRDALLAQRQARNWRLEKRNQRSGHGRPAGQGRDAASRRELERIERALVTVDARLAALRRRHAARRDYLGDHAGEAERLALVRQAESARELKVRVEAAVRISCPEIFLAAAGQRHLTRHTVERKLLEAERRGHSADLTTLLRPEDPLYEEVARRRPPALAAEVDGPDEPSLF